MFIVTATWTLLPLGGSTTRSLLATPLVQVKLKLSFFHQGARGNLGTSPCILNAPLDGGELSISRTGRFTVCEIGTDTHGL
jgi:hypothetical protein